MSQTHTHPTIHQNLSMNAHSTAPRYRIDLEGPLARDELCCDAAHLNQPFSTRYGCAKAVVLYIWDDGCLTRLHVWTARPANFLMCPATDFTLRFVRMVKAGFHAEAVDFILEHGTSATTQALDLAITRERTVAGVSVGVPAPATDVVKTNPPTSEHVPVVAKSQKDSAARTAGNQTQQVAKPNTSNVIRQRVILYESVVADDDWAVIDGDEEEYDFVETSEADISDDDDEDHS